MVRGWSLYARNAKVVTSADESDSDNENEDNDNSKKPENNHEYSTKVNTEASASKNAPSKRSDEDAEAAQKAPKKTGFSLYGSKGKSRVPANNNVKPSVNVTVNNQKATTPLADHRSMLPKNESSLPQRFSVGRSLYGSKGPLWRRQAQQKAEVPNDEASDKQSKQPKHSKQPDPKKRCMEAESSSDESSEKEMDLSDNEPCPDKGKCPCAGGATKCSSAASLGFRNFVAEIRYRRPFLNRLSIAKARGVYNKLSEKQKRKYRTVNKYISNLKTNNLSVNYNTKRRK